MAIQKTAAAVQAPRVNSERLSWKIKLLYGAPNFAGAALIMAMPHRLWNLSSSGD